jgi:sphingosine kinase
MASNLLAHLKLLVPKEFQSSEDHCHLVHLAEDRLIHVVGSSNGSILDIIDLDDVVGANIHIEPTDYLASTADATPDRVSNEPATDTLQDTQGRAVITIYAYPRQDLNWCGVTSFSPLPNPSYQRPSEDKLSKFGNRVAHHRSFVLPPSEDLGASAKLLGYLNSLVREKMDKKTSKQVLVLVNVTSGPKRNGLALTETVVQPMLEQAGMQPTLQVLTHTTHAIELAQESDLSQYSALIVIGGDGTFHQVLQGLENRQDSTTVLKRLQLGIVGCGTANGFAASILHEAKERYGVIESVFLICKGETVAADMSKYTTRNNTYSSFLTFTWAIVADIDIDSECIRFLGEVRFDIWGVLRILWLRRYRARFSFLQPPTDKSKSVEERKLPDLMEPVPPDWETVEDDFVLFWASQVSHASMSNHQSPSSRLNDGVFQILVIRSGVSKLRLIQILLGLSSGTHVTVPGMEVIECVAYRLEPLTSGSYNDIDGEVVEDGPIQACVRPGVLRVFGKGH